MKILMDTHAFLWFIEGDNNLSDAARSQKIINIKLEGD